MGGEEVGDPVATFLSSLGYHVDPVDWTLDDLPETARSFVQRLRLLCHYPDATAPFQVFHFELSARHSFQSFFDPICGKMPQANYLFLVSLPRNPTIWLVNPQPAQGYHFRVRYRTLRLHPEKLNLFQRRIVDSLRLLPGECDADMIAHKHRYTFDELQRLRRHEAEEVDDTDVYHIFLHDMYAYPVLDSDEQLRLARVVREGGPEAHEACDRLAVHSLRLVRYVALRYRGPGLDLLDLIQEGVLGLLKAIVKFDPYYGTRFSTYAMYWIRQAILRAVAEKKRLSRLPVHVHDEAARISRAETAIVELFGREATDLEIALKAEYLKSDDTLKAWLSLIIPSYQPLPRLRRLMNRATRRVASIRHWIQEPLSLELPLLPSEVDFNEARWTEIDENPIVADVIPDNSAQDFELDKYWVVRLQVKEFVSRLSERNRRIIEMRFGLGHAQSGHTLEEIGHMMGLTRERVRQIEQKTIKKMRRYMGVKIEKHSSPVEEQASHNDRAKDENTPLTRSVDELDTLADGSLSEVEQSWFSFSPEMRWRMVAKRLRAKTNDGLYGYPTPSLTTYLDSLEESLDNEGELWNDDVFHVA